MSADAPDASEVIATLAGWFNDSARPLPWRDAGTTPWAILVSEVMSQQTQVSRVEPKWRAFINRWPTPKEFAAASDAEAIRAWERLGYPRRAIQLRACAVAICERHDGTVPSDLDDLMALPGIGPYTAGAVRAFAFGLPAPVIDTNIRRVLTRVFLGEALPPSPNARRDAELWRTVTEDATDFEQVALAKAAMELGALVCTSRSPVCEACPLSASCLWVSRGKPAADPTVRRVKQASYSGSLRQMRGRILAELRSVDRMRIDVLEASTGKTPEGGADERFSLALASLERDGLIVRVDDAVGLPG